MAFVNAMPTCYNVNMLAFLRGTILEKGLNYLIVENQGLGYKVFVTPEIMQKPIGEEAALYVYHKVSEDGQSLFGLPNFQALQFFELLITVSGVGPKVALAILSSATVDSVKQAIGSQDAGLFTRISGIGNKTAERIIVDLKNKVGSLSTGGGEGVEVFDALLALGYNQREARDVLNKIDRSLTAAEQIRQALRLLGRA